MFFENDLDSLDGVQRRSTLLQIYRDGLSTRTWSFFNQYSAQYSFPPKLAAFPGNHSRQSSAVRDWLIDCMGLNAVFNNISVISRGLVHLSLLCLSPPNYIYIPSHWLLSYIAIVEAMNSGKWEMNPVAITIINRRKEYWPSC